MSAEAAFRAVLDDALEALRNGKVQEGERLAKATTALVRAERDVTAFLAELRAANEVDDEESARAELHRRLALLIDADRGGCSPETLAHIAETGSAP